MEGNILNPVTLRRTSPNVVATSATNMQLTAERHCSFGSKVEALRRS
jgi:hypothetical protein